jgi:hypothetical protein
MEKNPIPIFQTHYTKELPPLSGMSSRELYLIEERKSTPLPHEDQPIEEDPGV